MGVEYAHYLLAAHPAWIGDIGTARRVHEVLDRWQLVSSAPEVFGLSGGRMRRIRGSLEALRKPPVNLLVRYPFVSDVATIAEIMGPSYYPSAQIDPRYFQRIGLVVGTDYRIGPIDEQLDAEVVCPPSRDGHEVAQHAALDLCSEGVICSYPADETTIPPVVRLEPPARFPPGFAGVWRGGLTLDCGKDLPRIEGTPPLRVNPVFAADMEEAFGTQLIQIGRIY
jgi:hypothetical protein